MRSVKTNSFCCFSSQTCYLILCRMPVMPQRKPPKRPVHWSFPPEARPVAFPGYHLWLTTVERWIYDGEKQECRCWLLFHQSAILVSHKCDWKHSSWCASNTALIQWTFPAIPHWWFIRYGEPWLYHRGKTSTNGSETLTVCTTSLQLWGVTAPRSHSGLPLTTCFLLVFQRECFQISGVGSLR